MADGTVWIVVPVYNAEKTLKKCVKSILKQTYSDWRLVLVDDGSPDNSGKICDKFAAKDSRINVLHIENSGPSAARKAGVATIPDGGYCAFCDSDDRMPANAIECMMRETEKNGVDMVCGGVVKTYMNVKLPNAQTYKCFSNTGVYGKTEMLSDLYASCFGASNFPVSLWGKIYKTDKIKPVILDECEIPRKFAEDLDVNLRVMPLLDGCSIIPETVYYYRMGGGTSRFMAEYFDDSLFMYNRKKEYVRYYTGKSNIMGMLSAEILSNSITYLTMCKRFERYTKGSLLKETEYVCSLPEIREALDREGSKNLEWAYPGAWECMNNADYAGVEKIVVDYVKMLSERTLIKKISGILKK